MTALELAAAVAAFRLEVEDFISAVNRRFYMNDGSTYPDDGIAEVAGSPWASTDEVLATIPTAKRTPYLTVNVMGVEYWFLPDGSLVNKIGSLSLIDGSVTLVKMANMATASVIYRKSAGTGVPEVQSLATLRADLNIPSAVDMELYVLKISGYSLVDDALIAQIHAPGSDDQDLSGYVLFVDGQRMITTEEGDKLAALYPPVTITLPVATSVANRVAGAIELTNYPLGWTIEASGDNPNDLLVTHNLGRDIIDVKVSSISSVTVDGIIYSNAKTLLWMNKAYSGIVALDSNTLLIKNLATVALPLSIKLIF